MRYVTIRYGELNSGLKIPDTFDIEIDLQAQVNFIGG